MVSRQRSFFDPKPKVNFSVLVIISRNVTDCSGSTEMATEAVPRITTSKDSRYPRDLQGTATHLCFHSVEKNS